VLLLTTDPFIATIVSMHAEDLRPQGRLAAIDGLRGTAALLVLISHFIGHRGMLPLKQVLPAPMFDALSYGFIGVPVFFVLSGFVIAHSIGKARVDGRYIANFALRRSVRLDPPYWSTIALIIVLNAIKSRVAAEPVTQPDASVLLAHLTYSFEVLGFTPLLDVFWTLCHEVQFYLIFSVMLALIPRGIPLLATVLVTGLISSFGIVSVRGVCLETWYMFALGVLLYFARQRDRWARPAFFLYLQFLVLSILWEHSVFRWAAVGTAAFLAVCMDGRGPGAWLMRPPMQYLGRLSYSLYLLHGVVGWLLLSIAADMIGIVTPVQAVGWFLIATAVSVVAADAMCRLVERPSIALARKLKPVGRSSTLATDAEH
jgi:peptidoglycan/LPS O-acetylase OafA/YrhL